MQLLTRIAYGFVAGFGLCAVAHAAVLQRISDWGPNPSKIAQLHVYIPDRVAAKPPILLGVTIHFKMYSPTCSDVDEYH